MRRVRLGAVGLLTVVISAGLAGCAGPSPASSRARLDVVAAENFYGSLAEQVGGARVAIVSVLSTPSSDPHLFQPGARTGLEVATARVVIRNGAGYDGWMDRLLAAAPSPRRRVLTVADVLHVSGRNPNPHLWYDVSALEHVVTAMGAVFAAADPAHADDYRLGVRHTVAALRPLVQAVMRLRERYSGAPVAYTERVPGLLLAAAGLRVLTPPSFAAAVENGTDPSPADVAAMGRLLDRHEVRALLYNVQAASAATGTVRRDAQRAGVPVVGVTETQPAHVGFVAWQLRQLNALAGALGASSVRAANGSSADGGTGSTQTGVAAGGEFGRLLATHFVHVALAAGLVVALLAGLLGPFVVVRNNAFAVHGIAELGLTGAAGGLLVGLDATTGALLGSLAVGLLLGVLGLRGRDRDTATGALLAAGLGLGVLFLSKLHTYATTGFGLLFGSITTVSDAQFVRLALIAAVVGLVLVVGWRPLWFASVDPDAAEARGVPTRALAVAFPAVLAAAVAATIQVTGVLLILTLVVTPAAAAQRLTSRPGRAVALSVAIALFATVGGILASLEWTAPTSFYVATLSFLAYLFARTVPGWRARDRALLLPGTSRAP